jgi:putative PIN family toxin of toxin-antitoxin system
MIKTFVFDTNALVSSYILAGSKNRQAYNKAFDTGMLVYSFATFDEFAEVFVRSKFEKYLTLERRFAAIKEFLGKAFLINVDIAITECRDPKDNKFLELAVSANASCIITGDKDLLVLNPFSEIPILTATDFLNNF